MPYRAFAITTSSEALEVGQGSSDSTVFEVSNTTGHAVRVRLGIVAREGMDKRWLSLEGAKERDLWEDGTLDVPVTVSVPKDAAVGSRYHFDLQAISVTDPDEDYAKSRDVTITVKKARRRWLLKILSAIARFVKACLAGLVAVARSRNPDLARASGARVVADGGSVESKTAGLCFRSTNVVDGSGRDVYGRNYWLAAAEGQPAREGWFALDLGKRRRISTLALRNTTDGKGDIADDDCHVDVTAGQGDDPSDILEPQTLLENVPLPGTSRVLVKEPVEPGRFRTVKVAVASATSAGLNQIVVHGKPKRGIPFPDLTGLTRAEARAFFSWWANWVRSGGKDVHGVPSVSMRDWRGELMPEIVTHQHPEPDAWVRSVDSVRLVYSDARGKRVKEQYEEELLSKEDVLDYDRRVRASQARPEADVAEAGADADTPEAAAGAREAAAKNADAKGADAAGGQG